MRVGIVRLLAAIAVACLPTLASAQSTGEIFGKVTDDSDALMPGVVVTVSGPTLIQPLTATTTETGTYRFPQLPVGIYSVRFELSGFRSVLRDGVRIEIGFSAQINAALDVSNVEETLTVSGETPVVDTRRTGTASTFTKEMLENIPSSRDPWVMLEQTPGIALDRANVGGTTSGQQPIYVSRGATSAQNVWKLDGVNVTDMNAVGASGIYYNFDAFEEMQFTTAGNDVTTQTGGVGINLVTKSGTDTFRGSARYLITDEQFQGDNIDDGLRAQGATSGSPIQRNEDYGFDIGGPVLKGRAWFYTAYGMQDVNVGVLGFYEQRDGCPTRVGDPLEKTLDTDALRACLKADTTTLKNWDFKGQTAAWTGNKITWYSSFSEKYRNARDASDTRPAETVFVQKGPVWTHKFSDQQILNDRWLAEVQAARVGNGFSLDFPNPEEQFLVQRRFDELTNAYARAYEQSIYDRPNLTFDAKSTYFLPGVLGGDHSFKAGLELRDTDTGSYTHVGGYATARFASGVPTSADLHRDANSYYETRTQAFYLQDTFTRNRWTLLAGLRYDRQHDEVNASTVDANPLVPELLPAASFDGADSGVAFNNLSPRVGVTYDLTGSGRSIASVSASRYYGQITTGGGLASTLNPLGGVALRYGWQDLNGDELVQREELDLSRLLSQTGNYNPDNPGSPTTLNRVDPDIRNETTDEIVVGFQQQLGPSMGLTANYIWRRYDNFTRTEDVGITSETYREVTTTPTGCFEGGGVAAPCPTITYYEPTQPITGRPRFYTNTPDLTREYNGIEVAFTKRYTNRWMASASYAYNNAVPTYGSPRSFIDPTNIDKQNGAQWAQESTSSGIDNIWVNAKWLFRASGMYTLPWDVNVSGFLNSRQGYLFPRALTIRNRPNGGGNADVVLAPYGDDRHPDFLQVDAKVEKAFQIRKVRLRGSMSVFNLLNDNTVMARRRIINASNYLNVSQILAPRVIQFGVKVDF